MLTRRTFSALAAASAAFPWLPVSAAENDAPDADIQTWVKNAKPVSLPNDVAWETNNDDPLIGSPNAIKGGRLNIALYEYPLTFRLMGPNTTSYFASWNQQFAVLPLASMHPVTDKFIPIMATHWSVQKDQQTVYFKLDRDARFSDGHAITADDYVFTWRMMQSKLILDPYYNSYVEQYYKSVDKIDDYTLRVVGTRPSWRPLYDYAGLWPTPAHTTVIDKDWVTRTTNQPLVVPGPYIVSGVERGESVTFKKVPNWWGDNKRYFIGQNNFDEIHLPVLPPVRELDYVRQGELDMTLVGSKTWNEELDFPAVQNGWLRRARVYVDLPSGIFGLQINLEAPIFQNRDFRIAMQYLIDFDRLNRDMMYTSYYRMKSFFDGTEFANPDVKSYGFDPAKAREHLELAGYRRPKTDGQGAGIKLLGTLRGLIFTRSDTDDILVKENGEKASFTLTYDAQSYEPILTVIQQDFRRAGVDMHLQLLEPGTLAEHTLERKFEMTLLKMTSKIYPDPRQYLHTDFKNSKNNNDFWGFGTKEVDDLLKTYDESFDPMARRDALWRIDQIVHDEAFYIPFWNAPYLRLVYWDYLQFPDFYLPRRTDQPTDWLVYWIDPAKKAALKEAMSTGKAYPVDTDLDKDYYGVKQKLQ